MSKKRLSSSGFIHFLLLFIVVVIVVVVFAGYYFWQGKDEQSAIFNRAQTKGLNLVKGEQVDNQGCSDSGTVEFGTSPMDPKDVGVILPYGGMVGAHVTPIDHMYFAPFVFNSPRDTYEVRAMADGLITAISERTQNVTDFNIGTR